MFCCRPDLKYDVALQHKSDVLGKAALSFIDQHIARYHLHCKVACSIEWRKIYCLVLTGLPLVCIMSLAHCLHFVAMMYMMVEQWLWWKCKSGRGKLRIVRVAEELADTMIAARQSPFIIILSVSLIHTPFPPKQQQSSQPSFCHVMESNTKQHLDKMFLSHQCLKNGQRRM